MPGEGKGAFAAVVCIHGGGWKAGSRQSLVSLTEVFAKNNFVAVTISYRLAPKYQFPAQIEDCKAAVRWMRANAETYNIDSKRIGAVGFAAGRRLSPPLRAAAGTAAP